MSQIQLIFIIIVLNLIQPTINVLGQEHTTTLPRNSKQNHISPPPAPLNLPFFDDFSYDGPMVKPSLWLSSGVEVNNNMSINSISHGVATFDAWQINGQPYDTTNRYNTLWSDTLQSLPINTSGYTSANDLVLSFYVQQQGKGFAPHEDDSITIHFKGADGLWYKMWTNGRQANNDYQHVRIKLEDAKFFHSEFAFRFINKAQKNINNSNWNIDYVVLDKFRNENNEDISDLTITQASTSILKSYHAMPYSHFKLQPEKYLADNLKLEVKNNTNIAQAIPYQYNISYNGNILVQGTGNSSNNAMQASTIDLNNIDGNNLTAITENSITLKSLYTITDHVQNRQTSNDTLKLNYKFGNEFSYDDGTPEQAYFLSMHQSYNIPAMTAVAYELEHEDTLRGFSIHLPQEVPIPRNKEFSIRVYQDININGGQDNLLYEENYFYPIYSDTVNKLVQYKFQRPLTIPKGTFYLTLVQPSGGFSDSLYVGFDVDRNSKEKRFFSTQGYWESSLIEGSLLFRPIVGEDFSLSIPKNEIVQTIVYPNPVNNTLNIDRTIVNPTVTIYDINGKELLKAAGYAHDISNLTTGIYFVNIQSNQKSYPLIKVIKE